MNVRCLVLPHCGILPLSPSIHHVFIHACKALFRALGVTLQPCETLHITPKVDLKNLACRISTAIIVQGREPN